MNGPGARGGAAALALLIATLSALGLALALKDGCLDADWGRGDQYRRACYNDIQPLYARREFRGVEYLPLKDGGFPAITAEFEYPAGTGLFVGTVATVTQGFRPDGDTRLFFRLNVLGLFAAGAAAVALLCVMARDRSRLLLLALAPPLFLTGFLNWDLLTVGFAVAAITAFWWRADGWAGALAGLGAATKLYPAFLVPAFLLARWRETRRVPWGLLGAAAAGFALLNLPLLLANPSGWWMPWDFQSTRFPNWETHWYFIFRHLGEGTGAPFWGATYPRLTGFLSGLLFLGGLAWLLVSEARRPHIRPLALGFGIVIVFLLTAKVYSPQYALWVLPFFVLVRVPLRGYLPWVIAETMVWFAITNFFLSHLGAAAAEGSGVLDALVFSHLPKTREAALNVLEVTVLLRYAALGWLLYLTRRAEDDLAPAPPEAAGAPPALAAPASSAAPASPASSAAPASPASGAARPSGRVER